MNRIQRASAVFALLSVGVIGALPAWAGCKSKVWVESQERIELSAGEVDELEVGTHNGDIAVTAEEGSDQIIVVAKKRAGAPDEGQAQECMDALQITTEKSGRTQKLGRKLDRPKPSGWSVELSFEVTVPPRLAVVAKAHNGGIKVTGVHGDCKLETHNGGITAQTGSRRMNVKTHNGGAKITTAANEVTMVSHNGGIEAKLDAPGDINGTITNHNGGVAVEFGEQTATNLKCSVHNGRIQCSRDLMDITRKRTHLAGRLGQSEAHLEIKTHNGSITIR